MNENQKHLRELRDTKLSRLQVLELQSARYGIDCPAHIILEIEGIRKEIEQIQRDLDILVEKIERSCALISKYREPLLRSAYELQSRLYSIVQLGFLRIYYHTSEEDREYAINNTLYVIADLLGWIEILRQEAKFLDLGDVQESRLLGELLFEINQSFLVDDIDLAFRLFRGEQRAIGEIMLVERYISQNRNIETIGFAEFVQRLAQPEFVRWFSKLQRGIETLANEPSGHEQRLIEVQHALIDLIDFLDPKFIRIPEKYRQKISSVRRI